MSLTQNEMKKAAALAALDYITDGIIVGVGTGSTVNFFIDALVDYKDRIRGAVASSVASADRLKAIGIEVIPPHLADDIPIYVDGADEINEHLQMIKGGGAALTGEKIITALSRKFICIADQSKKVDLLGEFPLPVEVIPLARSYVARQIVGLGGRPVYREGCVTDYGNMILDVHGWQIVDPVDMEETLNNITGVVTNGLFAKRPADILLLARDTGQVETYK